MYRTSLCASVRRKLNKKETTPSMIINGGWESAIYSLQFGLWEFFMAYVGRIHTNLEVKNLVKKLCTVYNSL